MSKTFQEYVVELPSLMKQLMPKGDLQNIPKQGIYVLFENEKAIYVGRSNRMEKRLKEHGSMSSTHHSATLTFKMAKKLAKEKGVNIKRTRSELEKDTVFKKLLTNQSKEYLI